MSHSTALVADEMTNKDDPVPTAAEAALALIPILDDYNRKFAELYRDLRSTIMDLYEHGGRGPTPELFWCLVCRFDTMRTAAEKFAMSASGLVEPSALSYELRTELSARQLEVEEHLRQLRTLIAMTFEQHSDLRTKFEKYVVKTGRGSSPLPRFTR